MSEIIEYIRKPISEAAPCGKDVGYDDDYMALKPEIDKTSGNDWKKVVDLGLAILAEKSKDLNVATYLCIGLLQLQGFDGLADGLEGYRILLQEYWDGLYPQRERARVSALRMLSSKLGGDLNTMGLVEARQATDSDANALQRMRDTLKILNTEIQNKSRGTVGLKNIADAIEAKLTSIGAPLEETSITPSTDVSQNAVGSATALSSPIVEEHSTVDTKPSGDEKQEASPVEVSAETKTETVQKQLVEDTKAKVEETSPAEKMSQETRTTKEEPPSTIPPKTTHQRSESQSKTTAEESTPAISEWKTGNDAIETIVQAAAFLRSQDPQDVTSYRLLRSVRWARWQELPSDWRNNKSPLMLPQSEMKSNLDKLIQSESWEALLKQSEELFAEGNCHFWLDLQRYIDTALKGLGSAYDAVRKVILQETAIFVDRLPKITEFSYRDRTEFADRETKAWIEKEVRPTLNVGGTVVTSDTEDASVTRADASKEQKPSPPEVTTSRPDSVLTSSAAQQIAVGGDGAKVEISIKIFTK